MTSKNHPLYSKVKYLALIEAFVLFYIPNTAIQFLKDMSVTLHIGQSFFLPHVTYVTVALLMLYSLGMYQPKLRQNYTTTLLKVLFSSIVGAMAMWVVTALLNNELRMWDLALLCVLQTILATCCVGVVRYLILKSDLFNLKKTRTLFIGCGEKAAYVEKRMRRDTDRRGLDIIGFMPVGVNPIVIENETILPNHLNDLSIFASSNDVQEIVIAESNLSQVIRDQIATCKLMGIKVTQIVDFIEREVHQIPTNFLEPEHIYNSAGYRDLNITSSLLSRILDVATSSIVLLLTWPFILLTIIAIKLEDGWHAPVLYSQVRVGKNSVPYRIYKFRSMRLDAEKNGAQMATSNDDRITKVGKVIRKYRIDELPQIWNVLKGEMGLVGPRPERPEFVEQLNEKYTFFNERHNVKPGLTGWAQLMYPYGENDRDSFEKLKFDLYYIKHRSLKLDMTIITRTVEVVLFGRGQ